MIVEIKQFDNRELEFVVKSGIHYYKSIEPAFWLEKDKIISSSQIMSWYFNGATKMMLNYN